MSNVVSSIVRRSVRKVDEPLNILLCPAHERYETNLARTQQNFFALRTLNGQVKNWETKYAPIPSNYTLLNPHLNNPIPSWLDIDLVLSHNKFGNYQLLAPIAHQLGIPLICLEHTAPYENWPSQYVKSLKQMNGTVNVFISNYSRKQWLYEENEAVVVEHGIDTDLFSPDNNVPRERILASVVNDWINRNHCCNFEGWKRITVGLPVKVMGDTPGLSKPAKNINELVHFYRSSKIFLNTSTVSPIPMSMLEAMSCGCAPVALSTCMVPEIISHGINGLISNNEQELRQYCIQLINDPDLCRELGNNARQTILERFSLDKFVSNWNSLFYQVANL